MIRRDPRERPAISLLDAVARDEQQDRIIAARTVAVLRLALLPILFAGNQLFAHPLHGTQAFDAVLALALIYAIALVADSWRARGPLLPATFVLATDLLFVAALTYESGAAFGQLRAAFLALPIAAALLMTPLRTAVISAVAAAVFLLVAITHPTSAVKRLDVTLAEGLFVAWVGSATIAISLVLSRRRTRILELAAARGRLVAQAVDAEENARRRISDDLHDNAIQNVLTARQDLAEARAGDEHALERAEEALNLALEQLRSSVRELHPYLLDHLDLPLTMETIAQEYATRGGYRVDVEIDPRGAGEHDRLIVALTRELLQNVAKHARAASVKLRLDRTPHAVTLDVADDGRGFTAEEQLHAIREGHIGLASSRERVEACGGLFEIASAPGAGSRVRCTIPLSGTPAQQLAAEVPVAG